MQSVGGIEALDMLKEAGMSLPPIIAVTGSMETASVAKYKESGFTGCLAKPFSKAGLVDVLTRIQGNPSWFVVCK